MGKAKKDCGVAVVQRGAPRGGVVGVVRQRTAAALQHVGDPTRRRCPPLKPLRYE